MFTVTPTHAAFELAVYVSEDEAWDLHQRDDERSFSHRAEMITHQTHHCRQDGRQREMSLISVTQEEESKALFWTVIGQNVLINFL